MKLNPKVTWGLAWTGLAVVLAVPTVDLLTGQFGAGRDSAAVLTSDVEPVKTAAATPSKGVTTIKTDNGIRIVPNTGAASTSADPVDKALSSGKKLPDYISDGDTPASTDTDAPAKVEITTPARTGTADTQVAAIAPTTTTAPTPFPAWARPVSSAPVVSKPAVTTTAVTRPAATTPTITAPTTTAPVVTTPAEPVVIVDETRTGAIADPAGPVPPAPIMDDSANWDTESLRQYLERRGILEGGDTRSSANVTQRSNSYDPDGFYFDEGPNLDRPARETRRQRLDRLFDESGDDPESFTLF